MRVSNRAGGAVVAARLATGSMACDYDGSSLTLASDHLAYGESLRAVGATVVAQDDCRVSGMLAIGAAHVTGDGIACGHDPAKPFTGYFVMATPGFQVQGGMWGTCVVDGIDRLLVTRSTAWSSMDGSSAT